MIELIQVYMYVYIEPSFTVCTLHFCLHGIIKFVPHIVYSEHFMMGSFFSNF